MKYWSIDIGNVTVTFEEKHKAKLLQYLPDIRETAFYEGWINDANPSPNSIGFYITLQSDDENFGPDFHNLPYYYQRDYKRYMELIVSHVRRTNLFHDWNGQYSPVSWENFITFVNCLSSVPYKRL